MILAKIVFGTLIVVIFSSLLKLKYSNQLRIIEKTIIIFLLFASLILVFNPSILQYFADFLYIQRGRDLLFYIYILASIWLLFRCHLRINQLNNSINRIVSKISVIESMIKK